ncbi:hypothetical protein LEP1GSC074_1056 [Leptospira noguchii str. Hook]|uniref:Uncharacterized protein n=1 Tax=Leptospira noguchii serovar Autumnalis str. ZUN142 TaxID=1085540 RepID=M6U956_9LEPT|nr:hypothetical protein LEP1GSC041_3474 [Leptospira noguchii str. 2006001870]EMO30502.1 hypothetical protein LEP1GSC170_4256 [Leptospira interrogans serovar Bataviae str. HAI135]EMO41015.1 hypothetical protein LEP1GSC186_4655 [Leptospira noguchii serovar Autumnalis str. ZUN142]EMS87026.1 hypothetical protein LEP1GSC074_1056 [Leptospira noguchii str. Hook]
MITVSKVKILSRNLIGRPIFDFVLKLQNVGTITKIKP